MAPKSRPTRSPFQRSTDGSNYEQPLLNFGDARDGPFFPSLKSASIQSAVPFGPRAGRPLKRIKDPDLARAFEAAGWPSQRVSPPLVANGNGFSLHAFKVARYSGGAVKTLDWGNGGRTLAAMTTAGAIHLWEAFGASPLDAGPIR